MPTGTMRENLRISASDFAGFTEDLATFLNVEMHAVEEALAEAGAPWTPGRRVK